MAQRVAIGCDHAGYGLKRYLCELLAEQGYDVVDVGVQSRDSVDYADYAHRVAALVAADEVWRGLLVCGSGIGMCMTANRYRGVRAACCHDVTSVRYARLHNNANVLTLGERLVSYNVAGICLDIFLTTEFEGGRHQRRIEGIEDKSS